MKRKILCSILLSLFLIPCSFAQHDSTAVSKPEREPIYNATQLKLDILMPAIVAGTTKGAMQHYEMALNVRLAQRFYPTLELGYAGGKLTTNDSITYNGQGGFFRIGVDVNPLKKHPESPHALLVGIRVGTAVQEKGYTDCWGEIVLGCQVEMAKVNNTAFYMGWMGRLKCLFTREQKYFNPEYIPGFGDRNNIGWGVNYYLGWRF